MRLFLCGLVAVLAGLGTAAIGLLYLALPSLGSVFAARGLPAPDPRAAVSGGLTYLLAGTALGWTGVAAMRGRSWSRPVLVSLAWIWLVTGALFAALLALLLPSLREADPSGLALPQAIWFTVRAVVLGLAIGCGIAVPALVLWWLRFPATHPSVSRTDLRLDWSERCPQPVLVLAIALAATAVLALPTLARPVVPVLAVVLTGWPAAIATLAFAGVSAWLARSVYRLERRGLLATAAATAICGVALVGTILTVDSSELGEALGVSSADWAWLESSVPIGRPTAALVAVGATLASLAWLATLRRHFFPPGAGD